MGSDPIELIPANIEDQKEIYEWFAKSDITAEMIGPPNFPDHPIPDWEEFQNDYINSYFSDEFPPEGRCFLIQASGRIVGQINYNQVDFEKSIVELDIWLRSRAELGKGYGTQAIAKLCKELKNRFGIRYFFVQPSARNCRAVKSYKKVGFVPQDISIEEAIEKYGPNDYFDSVYMVKTIN